MPLSQTLIPNPAFKPADAAQKAAFDNAIARRELKVYSIKAKEHLKSGMWVEKPTGPERKVEHSFNVDLPSMTNAQLVAFAASLGITVQKTTMKKSLLIELIEKRMEERASGIVDDADDIEGD